MQHTRWSNTRHALHGDVAPEEVGQYKHSTDLGSGAWVPNGPDIRWIELGVTNVVLLLAGALAGFWTCAVHGMCTKCVFSCVLRRLRSKERFGEIRVKVEGIWESASSEQWIVVR